MGKRKIIENGTRFGKLLVVADAGTIKYNSYSWVVCDCGSEVKKVRNSNLTSGKTSSCGCMKSQGFTYKKKQYDVNKFFRGLTHRELKNEQWKQFRNTQYDISDLGRLRKGDYILNPQLVANNNNSKYSKGYLQYNLKSEGIGTIYAHRMVAEVFMDTFIETQSVHHLNEDTYDNRLINLEQMSQAQNVRMSISKSVVEVGYGFEELGRWDSAIICSKEIGVSSSQISLVCNGHKTNAKGRMFMFAKNYDEEIKLLEEV